MHTLKQTNTHAHTHTRTHAHTHTYTHTHTHTHIHTHTHTAERVKREQLNVVCVPTSFQVHVQYIPVKITLYSID